MSYNVLQLINRLAVSLNLAQMSLAAYCQTAVTCWAVYLAGFKKGTK